MGRDWYLAHKRALSEIASKTIQVPPFPDDSPEKRSRRITRATGEGWETFGWFCRTYFPHVFGLPFCDAHREMFEVVERESGITAITGFRGLGKTVLMGVVYPIWRIIKGERYVIHTAADVELAEERTGFTLHELMNNGRLSRDFPELSVADGDESDAFLRNQTRIRARSIKQSHRGTINPKLAVRPGLIVCDDIDKEENMGNQTIGRRRRDKITQEIGGALAPDGSGKVIWLGNLVHPNYAICQLMDEIIEENKAASRSYDPEQHEHLFAQGRRLLRFPLEDGDGLSVWKEQYPDAGLAELRAKFGHTGYQREFLGRPVIEGNLFKHEWFQRWTVLPKKMRRVWLYADPAWGEKGCYKSIISAGWDGTRFHVLHVWVRQTENTRFFSYFQDAWEELNQRYGVRFRAGIETTYGQQRILKDFERWARENGRRDITHQIKHIDNKENKHLRIERLETSIETGKVLFPDGQDTQTLFSQFLTYPQGYIDGCDALAGCLERFDSYLPANRVMVRRLKY